PARHSDDPALERHIGKFSRQIGIFRAAGAIAIPSIACLRHETIDHAMKGNIVVELVARELLDAFGVLGREIVAQLYDDPAMLGIDKDRILRIYPGRQWLSQDEAGAKQRANDNKDTDHGISRVIGDLSGATMAYGAWPTSRPENFSA